MVCAYLNHNTVTGSTVKEIIPYDQCYSVILLPEGTDSCFACYKGC